MEEIVMMVSEALFLLAVGSGLLGVTLGSLQTGWLPCGPRRFSSDIRVNRMQEPAFFWTLFAGYSLAGVWMAAYALRILFGPPG